MKIFSILISLYCVVDQQASSFSLTPNSRATTLLRPISSINKNTKLHLSRKDDLIQKAKEIDPQLKTSNQGSYAEVGWSNRLGTVLTPASIPGVYVACRPFYWNKIDVGGRMTVIELPPSSSSTADKPDLFIHSPVNLDTELKNALGKIGNVKHIVSPNYEHVKYAKQWNEAYPEAYMWGCPGLMERKPDVEWKGEIPFGCRPPSYDGGISSSSTGGDIDMWDWNIIQPMHLDFEVNPFTNKAFFNEVVFYHTPSKSLLFTDAYWNYPKKDGIPNSNYESFHDDNDDEESPFATFEWDLAPIVDQVPLGSRLWKFGMDKVYYPFFINLMVKDEKKEDFVKVTSFISGLSDPSWDIETIIPAHGDIVRGSKFVRTVLKDHFQL